MGHNIVYVNNVIYGWNYGLQDISLISGKTGDKGFLCLHEQSSIKSLDIKSQVNFPV
jgi:hypothetical protein